MTGKILSLFSGFVKRTMSGIEPDIFLHDSLDLGEYGIGGRVIATPHQGVDKTAKHRRVALSPNPAPFQPPFTPSFRPNNTNSPKTSTIVLRFA
jgi:hypothetical protein